MIDAVRGLDCKTVGFFLKISNEIGKAWRKSLTRAKHASLTRDPRTYHLYFKTNTKQKQTNKQTKRKKGQSSNNVFITVHTIEWPNINIGMPVLSAVTWSMCLKTSLT